MRTCGANSENKRPIVNELPCNKKCETAKRTADLRNAFLSDNQTDVYDQTLISETINKRLIVLVEQKTNLMFAPNFVKDWIQLPQIENSCQQLVLTYLLLHFRVQILLTPNTCLGNRYMDIAFKFDEFTTRIPSPLMSEVMSMENPGPLVKNCKGPRAILKSLPKGYKLKEIVDQIFNACNNASVTFLPDQVVLQFADTRSALKANSECLSKSRLEFHLEEKQQSVLSRKKINSAFVGGGKPSVSHSRAPWAKSSPTTQRLDVQSPVRAPRDRTPNRDDGWDSD